VLAQAPLPSQQVTTYLKELKARGLASFVIGKSTGGRPPKYWSAVLTPEEIAADEEARAEREAQAAVDEIAEILSRLPSLASMLDDDESFEVEAEVQPFRRRLTA
jgi:hypothetical protein